MTKPINEIEQILKEEKQNLINLLPEKFQQRMNENSYICGGCIYSLYHNQEPKDYDFFLRNTELASELMKYFKSQEVKPFKNLLQGKYKGLSLTISKYAISIGKYQIITKYIGEPRQVVEQFDFKHNCYWYEKDIINGLFGWEHLESNRVTFNEERTRDICGTLMRIPKFASRGMIITKKEVAKMLKKLQENGFDESEQEIIKDFTTY